MDTIDNSFRTSFFMSSDQEPTVDHSGAEFLDEGVHYIRKTLLQDHYDGEIDSALNQLEFNIVVMGSPRVGKSQLINALCENSSLAETSPGLDACTPEVRKYVMDNHELQIKGLPPIKINIFDTPGVESWKDKEGEQTILDFIEKSNPICVVFCASPSCFSPLEPLRFLLQYCHNRHIICALVCTNMWASNKRNVVIEEFKKELHIFGTEREVYFPQIHLPRPHLVTFFGNGALCTMVNSIEYVDNDIDLRRPVQGVDELINGIMELLDDTKLLGWCITVLHRRSFWEKISQSTTGFFQLRFTELQSIQEKSASEIGRDVLVFAANAYLNAR
jgi:GTP-binding protein EngB required for normal cell division